ncbi:MAG: glycoside hydrolase family 2 TIM barrel-domain containing protein [Eubacteriales bacterium]|nr:glycoside hydrolase family 2 TIM barrel-domain containing protein [Eubacteriales bacterium]
MREIKKLEKGWKFCLTGFGTEKMPEEGWQDVTVPHDWAIYGEFSPENDPQPLENSVLDYHEGMIQIGRTGGLPFIGTGWYKMNLYISAEHERFFLEFDGIMNHGEVWVNGEKAGERPYGYSSFSVDITPFVKKGERAEIVVKVNSMEKTSRWYPGAGIYRPARLVECEAQHFEYNGIWVRSDYDLMSKTAQIGIRCSMQGEGEVRHTVFDPCGMGVMVLEGKDAGCTLKNPCVWDIASPQIYVLMSEIIVGGEVKDRVYTNFGIRKAEFSNESGFFLNGKNVKIQGVCMHHDFGMLGAAYREDVMRKRLMTLKEMGCNSLRTTHNPPCPKTLDICDELGILVLDEAFDEWHVTKVLNGYATEFDRWAEKDLADMIHRDRNHPSVILYSVGNEIPEQTTPDGKETCKWLTDICHREDPDRFVTCGFNRPEKAAVNGLTEEVDVLGLNYCAVRYKRYHEEFPHWKLLGTETMSAVSSRGEYFLPAKIEVPPVKHENLHVNSYDYSAAACTYIPDIEFEAQKKSPYVAGQFVWTGYDYLGEPTPYREEWPSRSSYFGIIDLAGLKKDRYYAFAAQWQEKPVLHLFPHWNWEEGQAVDVHCYTNLDRVRLYLNGKEIKDQMRKDHRIVFKNLIFEKGELHAMGYRFENGREILMAEDTVRTAEAPVKLILSKDKEELLAGSPDVCYIEVSVADEHGTVCPHADNKVYIQVEGAGEYLASDAGDQTCLRPFNKPHCNAFHGRLVIAVKAKEEPGNMLVRVWADDIEPSYMNIKVY